ncbi:MAG: permease prefix domain 1-containing protein, partial [Planctomycetota bacterium]
MTDTRNDSRNQTRKKLEPIASSARDPIDRWLDVFVRLLRVPKQDAQRIRDELEDHLRARVDDLMVTGQSEPEAVRLAVAELGETAELARQFQTAAKPHRRRTMLAASAIMSAGLIASAVLLTQQTAPPPLAAPGSLAEVGDEAGAITAEPRLFSEDLPVSAATGMSQLADAVAAIESLVEARVVAHYRPMLWNTKGFDGNYPIQPFTLKGLTLEQGLTQLSGAISLLQSDHLALIKSGEVFELAPQSFFDRRDAVLIEYDVRSLTSPPEGAVIDPIQFQN